MTEFDILSFDGGGSKGVMEMVLLQDVMNMVTLLTQNPDKLFTLPEKLLIEIQEFLSRR